MALRLDGLSVTKPKGLKAGASLSLSLASAWSCSAELALIVILVGGGVALLLPVLLHSLLELVLAMMAE